MRGSKSDAEICAALLRYGSTRQAADALGLSMRTVQARRKRETFRQLWDEIQRQALQDAAASLRDAAQDAVKALRDIIEDENSSPQLRINAADSILRHCLRYTETCEILQRLDALEERGRDCR